ncbi:unnamed protein product [Caretta caretta]
MGASCAWTEPHLGQKHHGFGSALSGSPLRGVVGQNVVLPCKYHVDNKNNITTMYLPNHKGSDSCFLQLLLSVESSPSRYCICFSNSWVNLSSEALRTLIKISCGQAGFN